MRRRGWSAMLLAGLMLGSALGCGSADERSHETTEMHPPAPASPHAKMTPASQSSSALAAMSVFERPRTAADELPKQLEYRLKSHSCSDREEMPFGCPGDATGDESRLLLSGLGVRKTSLYAWPTTNGWVCWAWAEGAGGCQPDLAQLRSSPGFMGIDPDDEGIGNPGTLVGIVPDDVAAAEVRVRGVSHAAIVQTNGIFYELPDGSCTNWAFESVTVTYRDGRSDSAPINWHHGLSELPETCAA